jgi:lysozyme
MSAVDLAMPRLKTEEGFRAAVYRDTKGLQTIGYGFCVDRGITLRAAEALLIAQAGECHDQLMAFPWYANLDDARRSVLLDLAFNNGLHGLLAYVHMLAAVGRKDWADARAELLDSQAARELPNRYKPLADLLEKGA